MRLVPSIFEKTVSFFLIIKNGNKNQAAHDLLPLNRS
jgi:hypothetical protein